MHYYCTVIYAFMIIGIMCADDRELRTAVFACGVILLPPFGRIFGWW